MRLTPRLLAAVAAAIITAACADSPATPTSPSAGGGSLALTAERLAGRWTLTSLQRLDQPVQSVPPGASYTLSFADGRLSTRADCNTCSGTYTLSGATLTAGPNLACTRAACPTLGFETEYTRVLAGESTVTVAGSTLVLSSGRGVLAFSR